MADPKAHKKRKKRKSYTSVFPILYPSKMGTPYGYRPGSANDSGGQPSPPAGGGVGSAGGTSSGGGPMGGSGMGGTGESLSIRPSRARVIHEMKRSLGLTEYFDDAPQVAMGGYSIPSFAAVTMRAGGPVIGGPGFQHDGNGEGGVYNFKKSPGLGFKTEKAWKVWEKAMEIIDKDKTLSKNGILLRAMAKVGVHQGQMDPAEYRLLEMGIEWYLSQTGAAGALRTAGVY